MTGTSRGARAIGILLIASGACHPSPARFAAVVRDSAGIRIVENRGMSLLRPAAWSIDTVAVLDVGGDAPDGSPPYQITAAVRLGDGRIAVASNGGGEIVVYSADGRHVSRLGRRGDGPGEFRSIFALGVLPEDSLAAWDALAGRMTVFAPDGAFARVVTPRGVRGIFAQAQGWLSTGAFVLASGIVGAPPRGSVPTVSRDSMDVALVSADGTGTRSLGRFPGTEMAGIRNRAGGMLLRPLPFGRRTFIVGAGQRVYVGTGDRYEIEEYGAGGLRRIIRGDRRAITVTPRDAADYRRSLVTIGGEADAQVRHDEARLLAEVPYPETMPAVTDLKIDAGGRIWVKDPSRPGDPGPEAWTIFSADGRALGTIALPKNINIQQIGADWLLGIELDADHAEHVRLYRLRR